MRYALFSDIHSNLESFKAVIQALKGEAIDKYICIGDIVGYGADPGECIRLIRKLEADIVAGNHDYGAVEKTDISYFNRYAGKAVLWTAAQLSPLQKIFLTHLALIKAYSDFTVVHASLNEPEKWKYVMDILDASRSFRILKTKLLFIGHSHAPAMFEEKDKECRRFFAKDIDIAEDCRYIINIGSVGQPRDDDPRACFAIYDTDTRRVEMRRVDYDVQAASQKILKAGLPEILAYRIKEGK